MCSTQEEKAPGRSWNHSENGLVAIPTKGEAEMTEETHYLLETLTAQSRAKEFTLASPFCHVLITLQAGWKQNLSKMVCTDQPCVM